MTQRAYKYRIYPTKEQLVQLNQSFGCARKVYNHFLDYNQKQYKLGIKTYYGHWASQLVGLKQELTYLKDVSSVVLQQSLRHLDTAFKNFFKGYNKYPNFKKKLKKNSITYMQNAFKWDEDKRELILAKQKQPLDIKWSRKFEGEPSSVVVSKTSTGKFYISILVKEKTNLLPVNDNKIGLDVGLTHFVTGSDGEKIENPRFYVSLQDKLAIKQKVLSRAKKGSHRRYKKKRLVAAIHEKITHSRNNFLHQISKQIINKNQVICVEDLNVKGMLKNHNLAKAISDVGWSSFVNMLKYKADWYGRTFVQIDRWFPSSKTCHVCKHKVDKMPLDIREWTCPDCGTHHDRDVNAAINILNEGLDGLVRHIKCSSTSIPILVGEVANGGSTRTIGHVESTSIASA